LKAFGQEPKTNSLSVQGNLIPQGELKVLLFSTAVKSFLVQGNLIPQGELKAASPILFVVPTVVQGNLIPQGELKVIDLDGERLTLKSPRKSNSPRGIESSSLPGRWGLLGRASKEI